MVVMQQWNVFPICSQSSMKQFWKTRWMNHLFTELKGLHSHALIFLSFLIIINICKKNCEVSALKMPEGRTPYIPRDLGYFVLCCTIEEIFKGRHPTQERPSLLHHVTSGVTYLLSKAFVENFKDPRTNQILYYYFVIKGGWNLEPFWAVISFTMVDTDHVYGSFSMMIF